MNSKKNNKTYKSLEGICKFAKSINISVNTLKKLISGQIKEHKGWTFNKK